MPLRSARLAALPLFANLTLAELAELSRHVVLGHAPARTTLIGEGQKHSPPLYVLRRGRAIVRKRGPDQRNHDLSELHAPAVFGEIDVMARRPPLSSVCALTDVTYLMLPAAAIATLCAGASTSILKVLTNLTEVLRSRSRLLEPNRLQGQHLGGMQRDLYNGWTY
ncbi:MAG: cyclic nucleotide-binding domain-containing protein [Deltaproteobacteria bacterium]|nr:MAG: cyclic nucleotide-binding domain-containing protein [Deltaproteobacteria bacterium]